MAGSMGSLVVSLEANVARFTSDMNKSAQTTEAAMRKMDSSSAQVQRAFLRLDSGIRSVKSSIAGLAAGVVGGFGISQVINITDQYTKFTAQLKLATQSQSEYATAYADVQRISKAAQADLGGTGVLYARIANGTRELGVAQTKVAEITETINLALKVSGATAAESASAQLQLSQAFASGTLRGEEFNAVNEAAPRLMKALADGMAVPIGALKEMASNGQITTDVLASALPKALGDLRKEAVAVQTISGAFVLLKNEVAEFVGTEAQASGAINAITTGVAALANNLGLLVGVAATVGASKLAQWMSVVSVEAFKAAAAHQAQAVAVLNAAKADVTAAASASALATARVAELRASVLAAEGSVALAVATNGLIPAQTRAAAASAAHTAALVAQAGAQKAASVAANVGAGALGLLGGPIGLVTTLLGLGATAWAVWENSSKDAENKASAAVESSTQDIVTNLDAQIKKLRERNSLAASGLGGIAQGSSPGADRMASLKSRMDAAKAGTGEFAGLPEVARNDVLAKLGAQYGTIYARLQEVNVEKAKLENVGKVSALDAEMSKYATKAQKLAAELKRVKEVLGGEIPAELEKQIRDSFSEKSASKSARSPKAVKDTSARDAMEAAREAEAAQREMTEGWVLMIDQQIDEDRRKADEIESNYDKIKKAAEEAAKETQKVWDNFAENVQRNIGDGLYDMMSGNFKNIGDGFASMMKRMVADALAAKLSAAMFSGGESGKGWLGGLLNIGMGLFGGGGGAAGSTALSAGMGAGASLTGAASSGIGFKLTPSAANGYDIPAGVNPMTQLHEKEMVLPREHADVIRGLSGSGSSGRGSINYAPVINIDSRTDRSAIQSDVQRAVKQGNAELVDKLSRAGRL